MMEPLRIVFDLVHREPYGESLGLRSAIGALVWSLVAALLGHMTGLNSLWARVSISRAQYSLALQV